MSDERNLPDPPQDPAWRRHSAEEPPPHLDAAILAAAHRAVQSAPRSAEANRPWRWWAPLAAAATIGAFAIGVLQLLPSEHDDTSNVVSDAPRPAPAMAPAPRAAVVAAAPAEEKQAYVEAPRVPSPAAAPKPPKTAARAPRAVTDTLTPAPMAAPEPFPASRDTRAQEAASTPAPAPPAAAQSPGIAPPVPAPTPAPAAPAQRENDPARAAGAAALGRLSAESSVSAPLLAKKATRDDANAARAPEDFIAQIRKLFVEGNTAAAARELSAFRAAFSDADQRLPEDLRTWAATVKR